MNVERAQVGEDGCIVIPAAFRRAMGLKGGETVTIRMDEQGIHVQSRLQAIRRAQAVARRCIPAGVSLADELIAERREEAKREQDGL